MIILVVKKEPIIFIWTGCNRIKKIMQKYRICFWLFLFLQNPFAQASLSSALDHLIQELPEYKEFHCQYQVEKIVNGLTNHNFKVIFPSRTYFVRVGSGNPELLGLNADREYFCTQTAASLGIAPGILLYMPDENAMAFPFIASKPPEKNRTTYARVLSALKQFHQSGVILPTTFDPYHGIQEYYRNALALRPDHYIPLASFVLPIVEEIKAAVPAFTEQAPCHLDLYRLNFLDDGEKIWIIDWEYSAMGDPLYDLATLVSSDRLSIEGMHELLELYCDHPTAKDFAYLYLMSILADVRWWLWSYIQAEVSLIQSQYLDFADESLYQILHKTSRPEYQQSLQLLNRE